MSEPAVQCPLCKRVVKIVPSPDHLPGWQMVEKHNWNGTIGDLVDRLLCVQWSARCPMSEAPAERKP